MACAIDYNFDLSSGIIYTGGNYTSDHQDIDELVSTITSVCCNKSLVNDIKIMMLVDCLYLNTYSPQDNFQAFAKYGNHTIITKNIAKILKAINNETINYYTIPVSR